MALLTVRLGQTTFPELAASVGKVTPLTSALKISQEELFAVMATGTGVTGGAAEVATQLRGVLQSLMAPTADTTKLYKKMGVADGEALIKKKGLVGAIQALVGAAEKSGEPLQKYISSIEGQTIAMALAGNLSGDYEKKLKEMAGAAGTTAEAFNEVTSGVNASGFAWEQSKQKMIVAAQRLGDGLAPALSKAMDAVQPLIDGALKLASAFEQAPAPVQRTVLIIAGVAIALGPVLLIISQVIAILPVLGAAIGVLTGPIGLIVLAIAGLVAGLVYAYKHSEKFRDIVKAAFGAVKKAVQVAGKVIKDALGFIVDGFKGIGDPKALIGHWGSAFYTLGEVVRKAADTIKDAMIFIADGFLGIGDPKALMDSWGIAFYRLGESVRIFADGVIGSLKGLFDILAGIFTGDGERIKQGFKQIWDNALSTFTNMKTLMLENAASMATGIYNYFAGVDFAAVFAAWGVAIAGWFEEQKIALTEKLDGWKTTIVNWFEAQKIALAEKLDGWKIAIAEWFEAQKIAFIEKLAEWWAAIGEWFSSIPEKIKEKLAEWANALQTWATEQKERNKAQFAEWGEDLSSWYSSIPAKITEKLEGWKNAITTWYDKTATTTREKLDGWWLKIGTWFSEIPAKITAKLEEWWTSIRTWLTSVPDKPEVKNAGKKLIDKVAEGNQEKKQEFMDKLGKLIVDVLIAVAGLIAIAAIATGKEIINRIIEGMGNLAGSMRQAGVDTLQAFWNGLKSVFGRLQAWFNDKVLPLINKLNPWARHSPSLIDNVRSGVRAIEAAYNSMSLSLPRVDSLTPTSPNIGGGGTTRAGSGKSTYNFAPGSIVLQAESIRSMQDLIDLFEKLPQAINQGA